jgi:peptidoglycan/LPS O-acetylase OafA/YrhL
MTSSKILGLELIRFCSAFSVLIWHFQHFYYIGDKPGANYIVTSQPLYPLLSPFYQAGYYGVNIFWCISGFIFFWKYRDSIADRQIGPRKFFILRFSRPYPLHIVTLLLTLVLQSIFFAKKQQYFVYPFNDAYHFILQLFFASNWGLEHGYSFNGPIWSISVEVLVYVIFFATLRYIGRPLPVGCLAIAIAAVAKVMRLDSPIFDCVGFFYIGGMTCIARNYVLQKAIEPRVWIAAAVLVVLVPVAAIATGAFGVRHFSYLFWLIYTPLLLYVAAGDFGLRGRWRRVVEAAGTMTYSSYLIHFPLQVAIAVGFAWLGRPIPVTSAIFLVGFVGATLILAYLIFEKFEMPAQRMIRARFH